MEQIKEQVKDHESRIRKLEISDATMTERMDNLIKQLSSLTGWVKALVIILITSLTGFLIWYIQSLPRK
jgi:hypothetical protein